MTEKERKFVVSKPVDKVYGYLKNLNNYSHFFGSAVKEVNPEGTIAKVRVPILGMSKIIVKERVVDTKVVLRSKDLGVTLTVLLKPQEGKTQVKIIGVKDLLSPVSTGLIDTALGYIESTLKNEEY